jgi:hypothetical protein
MAQDANAPTDAPTTTNTDADETSEDRPAHDRAVDFSGDSAGTWLEAEIDSDRLEILARHTMRTFDEVRAKLTAWGLFIRAVDSSNVQMTTAWVPDSDFRGYKPISEGEVGISPEMLYDAVRYVDSSRVSLDVAPQRDADGESKTPSFTLSDPRGNRVAGVDATIHTDYIRSEPDMPDLDLSCRFTIPNGNDLRELLKAHKRGDTGHPVAVSALVPRERPQDFGIDRKFVISPTAEIDADPVVVRESETDTFDISNVRNSMNQHRLGSSKFDPDTDALDLERPHFVVAQSIYSAEYLKDAFYKLRKGDIKNVSYEVAFDTEFPISLRRCDPTTRGYLEVLLAPRIMNR